MEDQNGSISNGMDWKFQGNDLLKASAHSVRSVYNMLLSNVNENDHRPLCRLCRVDPTDYPSFKTTSSAVQAVVTALQSFQFNSYPPTVGLLEARRAVAEHLSCDLPFQLSADDVFLTIGGTQAIEIVISVLARPGANILVSRPGYPQYECFAAACTHLEVRHFDLMPEKAWEVNLDSVEALADDNTVAMVIINPSNPCGNVFTYQHLKKIAETARKLGIFVISDEVYGHLSFGSNPFVPMGVFSSIVPVLSIGSLSKRWVVPGWRFGWIVACDPNGIFKKTGIVENITGYLEISTDPPTFMQGALPKILKEKSADFFSHHLGKMREAAELFYVKCKEIPCFTCPHKPEGAMAAMVKLNLSLLEGITDDVDFCVKLAKDESVILLPGATVGLKNWLRISFGVDISAIEDGFERIKSFNLRHAKLAY